MAQKGETIGPYVIESLIAEGGMGAVYRARNRVTGQHRALKVIRAALAQDKDFVDRFVREATIASQVRHPFLVETLEPGIDGDTIYLPMELLEGETLLARARRTKRMSAHEAAEILAPVCDAVQALHDRRLVHRDIKPLNIFLVRQDDDESYLPKVLDLGTARSIGDDEHTATGAVVGSPHYMAPEQADGRRDIDGRVDQYAIGVIAYQLITGKRPYESDDTRSALAKLLRGEPVVPPRQLVPSLSPAVEAVILRALSHRREDRFPRAADLGAALVEAAKTDAGTSSVSSTSNVVPAVPVDAAPRESERPTTAEPSGRRAASDAAEPVSLAQTASGVQPPPAKRQSGWIALAVVGVAAFAVLSFAAFQLASSRADTDVVTHEPPPPSTADAPPPTTSVAAPPPVEVAVTPPAEPPTTPPTSEAVVAPTSTADAPPPTRVRGATGHRPPRPSTAGEPCGAATGIPCID